MINIEDLNTEFVQTTVTTHRIILFPNQYGLSIISGPFVGGDGVNTFELAVIKHRLNIKKDTDYFSLNFSEYLEEEVSLKLVYIRGICEDGTLKYANKNDIKSIAIKIKDLKC